MEFLLILLGTFILFFGLFSLLLRVKTPYYRFEREQLIRVLEQAVTGQLLAADWALFTSVPIRHDDRLESIRQACLVVDEAHFTQLQNPPYLFDKEGIAALRQILEDAQKTP